MLMNRYSSCAFSTMAAPATTMPIVKAMARKKKKFARPYQTAEELLQQMEVQTLLNNANLNPQMELDKSNKIAVLAHFSSTLREPLPSNVLKELRTANDIANWFSKKLQPVGARPHARKLIKSLLQPSDSVTSNDGEEGNANKEHGISLDDEINLSRESVQERLMQKLPKNLMLDDKTFMKPYPEGLPIKNLRSKGARPWRKVGEFRWPPAVQAHQNT